MHKWTVTFSDAYIKLNGNVTQCKSDKQQTNKQTTNRNLCFVFICFSQEQVDLSLVKFVELKTELKISNDYRHLWMLSLQTVFPRGMEF